MTKPGCALRAAGRAPRYGFLGMAGLTRRQTDRTVRLRRKPVMNLLSDMAGPSARAGPPSSPRSLHEHCSPTWLQAREAHVSYRLNC